MFEITNRSFQIGLTASSMEFLTFGNLEYSLLPGGKTIIGIFLAEEKNRNSNILTRQKTKGCKRRSVRNNEQKFSKRLDIEQYGIFYFLEFGIFLAARRKKR